MEIIFFAEEKEMEEDIWIRKRRKGTENEKRKISWRGKNYCGTGGRTDMFNISYAMRVKNVNVTNTRHAVMTYSRDIYFQTSLPSDHGFRGDLSCPRGCFTSISGNYVFIHTRFCRIERLC